MESGPRTGSVDRALCMALCAAAVVAGWQGGAEAQAQKSVQWCLLDRPRQWTTEGSSVEEKAKGDTNARVHRFGCARHQPLVRRHQRERQSDSVRVQCRLKALFRSRGVPTADGLAVGKRAERARPRGPGQRSFQGPGRVRARRQRSRFVGWCWAGMDGRPRIGGRRLAIAGAAGEDRCASARGLSMPARCRIGERDRRRS